MSELTAENEALRICVGGDGDDGPQLWVVPQVRPDVRIVDARSADDETLRRAVRDAAREPFDLARPPLWRIQLFRRANDVWVVAIVAHHIALDFWSLGLLLSKAHARLTGQTSPFTTEGAVFAEHAAKQASDLAQEALGGRWRSRWAARLAQAPVCIDLPTDRPRPPTPTYDGGSVPFALTARTSQRLRDLAADGGATPFMTVLAAYQVLLSRLSGQSTVVVATPTSGRTERRFRNAIGSLVNTIVLPGTVDEGASFRAHLSATRELVVDCMSDQHAPLAWLVGELSPPRDPSHSPLAQVGLAWDRLPFLAELAPFFLLEPGEAELTLAEAVLRPFPVAQQEGQLDLWVEMGGEQDGGYVGVLRYNSDILDHGTAADLARAFVATVTTVVDHPDVRLSDVAVLDGGQATRVTAWGRGPERVLPDTDVAALVRAHARSRPRGHRFERYRGRRHLRRPGGGGRPGHRRAAVAGHRRRRPGRRDARQGPVAGSRAARRAAGQGSLRATGSGLPRRQARLHGLRRADRRVADPAVPAVQLARRDATSEVSLCLLDRAHDWFAPEQPAVAYEPADGSDLAYVLYTSGSTGRPKGVAIPHVALLNLVSAMSTHTAFGPDDSLLAVTTVSFDIAGLELFMPLVCGGRVIVCPSSLSRDAVELAARLGVTTPTWMQATPSTWGMLRETGWQGDPRLNVLCGGEPLPEELATFLTSRVASLTNVYGPTETTIWSTAGRVDPANGIDLGVPLDNTLLYVTDPFGRFVAPGMYGELWIGGAGLAQGYWGRHDLTDERFRSDLPCAPGERLYRTGDRVRWSADGRLQHHGRLDSQVKVRGYRIELAEVEAVLGAIPGVAAAAVDVREDRLVAYLVPTDDAAEGALGTAAVLAAAARSLPPYMVPSAVTMLHELPLTANKKIDRSALPAPQASSTAAFLEPRDAVEITLARMWGELLGIERVGIHDDFFELGGHSLLAVRLSAMIRDEWGRQLKVNDLLRHSTIEDLAVQLRDQATAAQGPLVTLRQGNADQRPLLLFHPFGGTVFCYVELARRLPPGVPVVAIEAPGLDVVAGSEMTVETMAAHYLSLVREVQPEGPYALGGWCFGGVVAFEAARQLLRDGESVELLVTIDSRAPLAANVPEGADDLTLLSWFARDLAVPYGRTLDIAPEEFRGLDPDAAFDHVLERAAAIGVLAPDSDRDQMRRYFEVYLASGVALQLYAPPPVDLDLVLLKASDEVADYGPVLGWDALVAGDLQVVPVPGDHNSVMQPPNAATVASVIGSHLADRRTCVPVH